MTRSAWVTVRLPGARTAPPTSTRIWFQTGVVKHGRKTASHDGRIAGTVDWSVADSMRFCVIESVESSRPRRARVASYIASQPCPRDIRSWLRLMLCAWTIRSFNVSSASVAHGGPCTRNVATAAIRFTVRRVGRTFASDRIGRQVRSALLVALEGPVGLDRPVRTHRPVDRRRTTLHRPRGYLLGYHLTAKRMKNAESRAKGP